MSAASYRRKPPYIYFMLIVVLSREAGLPPSFHIFYKKCSQVLRLKAELLDSDPRQRFTFYKHPFMLPMIPFTLFTLQLLAD